MSPNKALTKKNKNKNKNKDVTATIVSSAWVMRLCACVRYWSGSGFMSEYVTCFKCFSLDEVGQQEFSTIPKGLCAFLPVLC